MPRGPALGIVELSSIARGIVVADAIVKRAPARLLASRPVSGGKHLIVLDGEVAEVDEAMQAALEPAAGVIVDSLELPLADEQLWPFLPDPVSDAGWSDDDAAESVAVVETATVCACVGAGDAACKVAPVTLRDMRLAIGISGKAFFTMTGRLPDVEAAADEARGRIGEQLLHLEIVASPAGDIRGRLIF